MTAREIEAIPRENLRVPRGEFVAVWREAELLDGWYAAAVAITCRWLAGASVVFNYPHGPRAEPAYAPATRTRRRAHEELIEAECLAADRLAIRHPAWLDGRPGWVEGVVATLHWVWRGSGAPPLDIGQAAAG